MSKNRGSIYFCDCEILAIHKFASEQYVLTLSSSKIANTAKPGQFTHIQVSSERLMRIPISIMLVDRVCGNFDILYKVVGKATKILAQRKVGDILSVIGPIGNGFNITDKKLPLLIGGGVGMPPIIAMAQQIKNKAYDPLVILGSEVPFPFASKLSKIGKYCSKATHSMPLLESWGIASRLTSLQGFEGVYKGYVTDLAREYLLTLAVDELVQVEIYACGPVLMLKALTKIAYEYNLPVQISLEEYMPCGVGGCAGCVVKVTIDNCVAMKRVCVDGPVFDAKTIFL